MRADQPREQHEAQASFDGMAPPANTRATTLALCDAGQPLRLAVMGHLVRDAVARETASGGACVDVLVHQQVEHHPGALPLYASEWFPPTWGLADAFDRARGLAAQLRAGEEVVISGRGLERGRAYGEEVLRVIHTIAVRPSAAMAPLSESDHAH